jgi:DNA-binding PadR family transcriptional regulator
MEVSAKKERSVPMRSPVNWTVLGLVIERSSYGWELWTRFERLYGDVLPIGSESNIYAALNVLREKGLIEEVPGSRTVEAGASRQPKPHYRATREGLDAYEAWVIAQMRENNRRSRQFARQLGALAQQPQTALEILARYEQACLEEKGSAIPTTSEFPTRVVPGLGDNLASVYGRLVVAATLGWVAHARREFATLVSKQDSLK